MPEVLTERETTRRLFDQGCEKHGVVPFMREVNALLSSGMRVNEAMRQAGFVIELQWLKHQTLDAAKAMREAARKIEAARPSGFAEGMRLAAQLRTDYDNAELIFNNAVDALIDFESSQIKK